MQSTVYTAAILRAHGFGYSGTTVCTVELQCALYDTVCTLHFGWHMISAMSQKYSEFQSIQISVLPVVP